MRKILIGQQPGKKNPPSKPLWAMHPGSSGRRLAQMAGLEVDEYHELFYRRNINDLTDVEFTANKQTRWRGARLLKEIQAGDVVVIMGNIVCECLGLPVPDNYFKFKRVRDPAFMYAVIPHPSGLNRFYNSRENWDAACDFMRSVVAYPDAYDPDEHPWNKPESDD